MTITFIITVTVLIVISVGITIIAKTNHSPNSADICEHKWKKIEETFSGEFNPGYVHYRCYYCNNEKTERIKATCILPQIYFDGITDGIQKDSEVIVKTEYFDGDTHFSSFAAIKYQGHTSMKYDKKNYTVKFYKDKEKQEKNKISLNGWKENSKYCLKANYIDFSQSRNIVSANIWTDVVGSRKNIDENIASLQYYGAVDGYPVMVFINDTYRGIYTMNIPKDDDTYGIGDEKNEALFVINSSGSDSSYFKSVLSEEDKKSIFDLEYCYGEKSGDTEWAYNSLDELINFVINNDGNTFKEEIEKYLDIESAIDYLLTSYYLGLTDNFAKNALMLTYNGEKWIFSLYDMDTAFGLSFDGTVFFEPDFQIPVKNDDGSISSSTGSLLWDKLLQNFYPEICERYKELRKTVFVNDSVVKRYDSFIKSIPQTCFEKEIEIWGNIPLYKENNIEQINEFLNSRSKLLDEFFINN